MSQASGRRRGSNRPQWCKRAPRTEIPTREKRCARRSTTAAERHLTCTARPLWPGGCINASGGRVMLEAARRAVSWHRKLCSQNCTFGAGCDNQSRLTDSLCSVAPAPQEKHVNLAASGSDDMRDLPVRAKKCEITHRESSDRPGLPFHAQRLHGARSVPSTAESQ